VAAHYRQNGTVWGISLVELAFGGFALVQHLHCLAGLLLPRKLIPDELYRIELRLQSRRSICAEIPVCCIRPRSSRWLQVTRDYLPSKPSL